MSRALAALAATALLVAVTASTAAASAPPPIHHVFVIVLENEGASQTFGANPPAPYLAQTLVANGAFVPKYYGTGHESLDNYIAMISGQAPNADTQGDCQFYQDLQPGTVGAGGQAMGQGCVYPKAVQTVADQLGAAGLTWRGYMESMGNDPSRDGSVTCAHPALNSQDGTQKASPTDQYAARHDPFVYFHSIIDNKALCNANVVPLTQLEGDLSSAASTPNLVFITPSLCNDGHDATCADGGPGGYAGINGFLASWVPKIVGSPAFQDDGLLIVNFDEAGTSDTTACCNEQTGPNTISPGIGGPGGGDTGAVLLSRFIAPGTVSKVAYNHYSLLRSIEDIFQLPHLGYANQAGLAPFGSDVYTAPGGEALPASAVLPSESDVTPAPGAPPAIVSVAARRCRASHPRARGRRLPANSVFRRTVIVRHGARARLHLLALAPARLTITRGKRTVARVRISACRRYSVRLPGRHGRLRVTAARGRARQVRTVRY